jgi:hypothetical protein
MESPVKAVEIPISHFGKEAYIQELLAKDPSLLGFGDLILIGSEIKQSSSSRLDLLFKSADDSTRYEVEVQLGPTNESHIIRTIEYWDIERRQKPSKKHIAVLVAERITSRFFNVIGLFNRQIPIAAIQMQAYDVGGHKTIIFTSILNHSHPFDDTEEELYQATDSVYWKSRTSEAIMNIVDEILALAKAKDKTAEFKYTKGYIKIHLDGKSNRFATITPQKKRIGLALLSPKSIEMDRMIEDAGYELDYDEGREKYLFSIYPDDFEDDKESLRKIIHSAYDADFSLTADQLQT